MSEVDKESKTEQPTGKKLHEELRKSPPPQSRDLTSTVTLLASVLSIYFLGSFMFRNILDGSRTILSSMGTYQITEVSVYNLMLKQMGTIGLILGPYLLVVLVAGIAVNFAQGGIVYSTEKLKCNFGKLNPLNGMTRFFNKDSVVEIAKSLLKISIVGYISYRAIRNHEEALSYISDKDVSEIFTFVGKLAFKIIVNCCEVLLVLAFLDLAFVKWSYLQNMRMTKEEVKQEHKETEGDQQVKGRIRRLQYEQSRRRMLQIIPTADVVITNPTHFAVALKYDREKMAAPVVIAKGADHLAQRIKQIARDNRVMLVENRFLARELYATVKEGHEVPESLYTAVAEVLAYVFSLKGKI